MLPFDCDGLQNCVAMQAYDLQEGSGCWHCMSHGWGNGGIGLEICKNSAGCQNSSFQDLDVGIEDSSPGNTCATSVGGINTVPLYVHSNGNPGPRFIKGVTVSAAKCHNAGMSGVNPTDSIRYSSEYGSLENLLVEQGTTLGLRLGADGPVNSVTVFNVQSGPPVTNGTTPTCNGGAFSGTTAVWLDPSHSISNLSLSAAAVVPNVNGNAANILVDCFNKIRKQYGSGNHGVVQWVLNDSGHIVLSTGDSVTTLASGVQLGVNTIAATAASLDLTTGNIQQLACPSSGAAVSPVISNQLPGMELTFIFVQIGSGLACNVAFPSNMHGGTVSAAIGSVTTQKFIVSNNGTDLYAEGAASICTSSCGTP